MLIKFDGCIDFEMIIAWGPIEALPTHKKHNSLSCEGFLTVIGRNIDATKIKCLKPQRHGDFVL
jgi:hypothetical protein